MNAYAALREFAIRHRDIPVVTLSVCGRLQDPSQHRAWLVAARDAIAAQRARLTHSTVEERAHFERLVSRLLTELPSDQALHRAGGWVGWCADDEVLTQSLSGSCVTRATWQHGPAVLPYLTHGVELPVFVLQVDREHATLMRLDARRLDVIRRLDAEPAPDSSSHMGNAPEPGFHPGTRGEPLGDRAQRRMNEARRLLESHTLATLPQDVGPHGLLLVSGPDEVVAHFTAQLPEALSARSAAFGSVRPMGPSSELVDRALEVLPTLQARRDDRWFAALRERSSSAHPAALGVHDVREALTLGAVERLVLTRRFLDDHPLTGESLALAAICEGADVSVAGAPAETSIDRDAGGIVASLRFAAPRLVESAASGASGPQPREL